MAAPTLERHEYCRNCGHLVPVDGIACPGCGVLRAESAVISKSQSQRITVGFVLGWIYGSLVCVFGAIMLVVGDIGAGLCLILSGLVAFPPFNERLAERWHITLSSAVRVIAAVLLFGLATKLSPNATPSRTVGPTAVTESAAPAAPAMLLKAQGTGIKSTATFQAPGEWKLSYWYVCPTKEERQHFAVYGGGDFPALVLSEWGNHGKGRTFVHRGGAGYLEVSTPCDWWLLATTADVPDDKGSHE